MPNAIRPCLDCGRPINIYLPHIYDNCPESCPFDTNIWDLSAPAEEAAPEEPVTDAPPAEPEVPETPVEEPAPEPEPEPPAPEPEPVVDTPPPPPEVPSI